MFRPTSGPLRTKLQEPLLAGYRFLANHKGFGCLFVACLSGVVLGCNVTRELKRTLTTTHQEERRFHNKERRNQEFARTIWQRYQEVQPEFSHTPHFREGFCDGVIFYLEHGGVVASPTHPPFPYWSVDYQTPEGRQAIDQWHSGFREGMFEAERQGVQESIVLPIWAQHSIAEGRPRIKTVPEVGDVQEITPLPSAGGQPPVFPEESLPKPIDPPPALN
jgi:hypothetical protein